MLAISNRLTQLENLENQIGECVSRINREWLKVGELLRTIRDERLYKPDTFRGWLKKHKQWGITRQRADQYIRAWEANQRLEKDNNCSLPNEAVSREIIRLPEQHQSQVWGELTAKGTMPTAKVVRAKVLKIVRQEKGHETPQSETAKCYQLAIELSEIHAESFETLKEILGDEAKPNRLTTRLEIKGDPESIGKKIAAIGNILPTFVALHIKVTAL
jgi:hypothetical protein